MSAPEVLTLADVIARAVLDAQATVLTHVPGYGGTEVFRALQALRPGLSHAYNEEPAFAIAHGASLVGRRAACFIKTHGFAKAANAVLSALSAGALGGFVTFAFDDPQGSHSDNILPAESLVRATEIPFERLSLDGAYEQIVRAFERSESLGLPYLLLVDCREVSKAAALGAPARSWSPLAFSTQPLLNVVCPPLARFQRAVLEAKLGEDHRWRALLESPPTLPAVPEGLPVPLRDAARAYVPVFEAFRQSVRAVEASPFVAGDAGTCSLFAFPPYGCVDACTYMGGSVPLAVGAALALGRPAWAVTGDFSFLAAGALGLLEARRLRAHLKVLVFDNGRAAATGNQPVEPELMQVLLAPYRDQLREVSADDPPELLRSVLAEAHGADGLRIVRVVC